MFGKFLIDTNLQLYDEDAVERSDPGGSPASPDQLTGEIKRLELNISQRILSIKMHARSHHPNNDDSFFSRKSNRLYIIRARSNHED